MTHLIKLSLFVQETMITIEPPINSKVGQIKKSIFNVANSLVPSCLIGTNRISRSGQVRISATLSQLTLCVLKNLHILIMGRNLLTL